MVGLPTRRFAVTALTAAVCSVLTGCTTTSAEDPASSPTPSPVSSASASSEPFTLRFGVYGEKSQIAAYRELARTYMEQNPAATIVVEAARSPETAIATLGEQVEEGTAPDIFVAPHDRVPGLVADERVQPVSELLAERGLDFGDGYHREGLEAFSADTALQCMPHDVSPVVVYLNEDLVDLQALVEPGQDPPAAEDGWSWEEFALAARQASRGPVHGVYIKPRLEAIAPFIWSTGGELVDDIQSPTSLAMDSGDTREALELVLELVRDPNVMPTQPELAKQSAVARFETGNLGMLLGTRQLTPRLRAAQALDFEVFPLPSIGRFRTISSMSGYCISADSAHIEAAADFLAYAVSEEGATITTEPGYVVPSNLQVAYSTAFRQPTREPENTFVFNEGVRRTEPTPFVAEWPRVVAETEAVLQRMFYSPVIDLDALLVEMDERSQQIFDPVTETETPDPE